MTCKKCEALMRLWLERPSFKTYECPRCDFVAVVREEPKKKDAA